MKTVSYNIYRSQSRPNKVTFVKWTSYELELTNSTHVILIQTVKAPRADPEGPYMVKIDSG